jgi:hypothetical protein
MTCSFKSLMFNVFQVEDSLNIQGKQVLEEP